MIYLNAAALVTYHSNAVIIAPINVQNAIRSFSTDNVIKSAEEIYFAIMCVKHFVEIVHLAHLNAQSSALILSV